MKSFLSIEQLNASQVKDYFEIANLFSTLENGQDLTVLNNKTVTTAFFEDSTRTRNSFEKGATRLGAKLISFSAATSSVKKGESVKDTLLNLEALGTSIFVVRHKDSGILQSIERKNFLKTPIINGGDGAHQHPSQAMYDSWTAFKNFYKKELNLEQDSKYSRVLIPAKNNPQIPEKIWNNGKPFAGKKFAIVGDLLHSRVVRSNVQLLDLLGATVYLVAPKSLMPKNAKNWGKHVIESNSFDQILETVDLDALMMLRIQQERMTESFFPSEKEYTYFYGLTTSRLKALPKKTIIMHPGPVLRGLEISSEAVDSAEKSVIIEQVQNAIFMRMTIIFKTVFPECSLSDAKKLCSL